MIILDKKQLITGCIFFVMLMLAWYWSLFVVTTEEHQGDVYRIIYLHVPSVFTAFLSAFILLCMSILGLWKKSYKSVQVGLASAEVGLLFTFLGLATGSIWGKPTWGTWWTWDARLTTTFILALLYCGYILLWNSVQSNLMRIKVCSVLGIMIAANIPIIYKSVTWWRTLHQPPSIFRRGGSSMSPEILSLLLINIAIMLAIGIWLIIQRYKNITLGEDLEEESYLQIRQQEGG
ncbi:MAG: cytochrome c biogenesis protein CcsA [Bdellovibrionota bacterium]